MDTRLTLRRRAAAAASLALGLFLIAAAAIARGQGEPDSDFFEKRVRPILVENCAPCHSSKTSATAGLALDSAAAIRKGGSRGPALVAGHPEQSLLIRAISYEDKDLQMPPKGRLPEEQRKILAEWIKRGAFWPGTPKVAASKPPESGFDLNGRMKHWAWKPVRTEHGKRNTENGNPIDGFVREKLRAKGLTWAKPADRRTLIRRAHFDLIGLPPSLEEYRTYMSDTSDKWYERMIDALLASPHFGERWARHWLDLARYAETDGHEFDFEKPNAYRYRDYVIRAFNADVPFDQFVMEHVAGDLLPNPRRNLADGTNESIQATGFWWLGEGKHSPVDLLVDEAERVDNQIDVFTKTFLGMGVACARCHDHKFDAITTKDFYALSAVLKSSRYQQGMIDLPEPRLEVARQLRRLYDDFESRLDEQIRTDSEAMARRLASNSDDPFLRYLRDFAESDPLNPLHPIASLTAARGLDDYAADRERVLKFAENSARDQERFRKESMIFEDFASHPFEKWHVAGEAFRTDRSPYSFRRGLGGPVYIPADAAYSGRGSDRLHGTLRSRTFTITKKSIAYRIVGENTRINLIVDNFQRIRDPLYGGLTITPRSNERFEWQRQDVSKHIGHRAYIEIVDSGNGYIAVDEIRFVDEVPLEPMNALVRRFITDPRARSRESVVSILPELIRAAARAYASDSAAGQIIALLHKDAITASLQSVLTLAAAIERELPEPRYAMSLDDGTGQTDRVHIRGSTANLGEVVPRRFLEAFGGSPLPGLGSGRLMLAQQMLKSPLVPRVIVNRLWHHHFGTGIVKSVDDFGLMGTRPTHPELLDWLAAELMSPSAVQSGRSGRSVRSAKRWSLKHIHWLIVTSETYKQASVGDARAESADPENKLLHRMPVRRLEAEAIRDGILAVSGQLKRQLYGPSVLPNLTPFMEGRGKPARSGPLDGGGRRSIYIGVRRNFLTPMLLAFDYPVPFSTMGRRTVSNVPAQALTLLNNPFVTQQAEAWARRILAIPGSPDERIRRMYLEAFARPPDSAELEQARGFVAADTASAWADLAHVLFNVKEFIFLG